MMAGRDTNAGSLADIPEQMHELLRAFVAEAAPDPGPYYQPLSTDEISNSTPAAIAKALRFLSYLTAPVPRQAAVLDMGSGYGLNCILLGLLGFRSVMGVEMVESLYRDSRLLLDFARARLPYDLSAVSVQQGDIQDLTFPDSSFDCALCIEVISHVVSQDALLREANRLLTKNGILVLSDGCNITCPKAHQHFLEAWSRVRAEEMDKRLAFLADRCPDLDAGTRESVAIRTELLGREALEELLPRIASGDELPDRRWKEGTAPVYFESGIWAENGIELPELERRLERHGFSSRVVISYGGCRGPAYRAAEMCLNLLPKRIRYRTRPVFRCWARKTGTRS